MYFSKATVLAVTPFLLGFAAAAPPADPWEVAEIETRAPISQFHKTLKDLATEGRITWEEGEGGRFTHVSAEDMGRFEQGEELERRQKAKGPWKDFKGLIDTGYDKLKGSYSCLPGALVSADDVKEKIQPMCEELVGGTIAGQLADKAHGGWMVYQATKFTKGKSLFWAWQHKDQSSSQPPTTRGCKALGDAVFGKDTCASTDDKTRGAEVRLGEGQDQEIYRFDVDNSDGSG